MRRRQWNFVIWVTRLLSIIQCVAFQMYTNPRKFWRDTSENVYFFVQNFFKTKYVGIISFLVKRSRRVDAKNDQTLDLTPAEHWNIVTWSRGHIIYVRSPALKGKELVEHSPPTKIMKCFPCPGSESGPLGLKSSGNESIRIDLHHKREILKKSVFFAENEPLKVACVNLHHSRRERVIEGGSY